MHKNQEESGTIDRSCVCSGVKAMVQPGYLSWKIHALCLKSCDWGKVLQKEHLTWNRGAVWTGFIEVPGNFQQLSSQHHIHLQQHINIQVNTLLLSHFLFCFPLLWNLGKCEKGKRHGLIWKTAISWRFISPTVHRTATSIIYSIKYKAWIFY